MSLRKPYKKIADVLKEAGLRPTSQRMSIAKILFGDDLGMHRHVTADQLFQESLGCGMKLSLATIYNNLNSFKEAGLIQEVVLGTGQTYYDTNVSDHHHFFVEKCGSIIDIDNKEMALRSVPNIPTGKKIKSIQVIVRLEDE